MDDKKITAALAVCLTAVFCFTLYLATGLGNESDRETVVIIEEAKTTFAITSPTENITTSPAAEISETQPPTEKLWLNINTATSEELQQLNGIGPQIANSITEYRTANGDFRNIEQLLEVNGIGEKKLEGIRNNIYVENPAYYTEQEDTSVISREITETEPDEYIPEPEPDPDPEETEPLEEDAENPTEEETLHEPETATELTLEMVAPININTAEAEELMLLPYVTEEIAERIITLREEIGGYTHEYELLYIEELEQKQVAEIIEFVTVGQ